MITTLFQYLLLFACISTCIAEEQVVAQTKSLSAIDRFEIFTAMK